jgi:hypothetical protein
MKLEINDLVGLSKPLTKLVEVISAGIGNVSESYLIKKNADARAYELRTIKETVQGSHLLLENVKYENGAITVASNTNEQLHDKEAIKGRSLSRIDYQEERKQNNIESITQNAAQEITNTNSVSSDDVDDDWIARFFRYAEDVSSEEMQILWGRVLAGEVSKPNSFSIRTLELLKSLSKEEAQLFEKVSNISFKSLHNSFILKPDNRQFLRSLGVTYEDILLLRDVGLLHESDSAMIISTSDKETTDLYIHGDVVVLFERKPDIAQHQFNVILYTPAGNELISLIKTTHNIDCIRKLSDLLLRDGVTGHYGELLETNADGVLYNDENKVELPLQ